MTSHLFLWTGLCWWSCTKWSKRSATTSARSSTSSRWVRRVFFSFFFMFFSSFLIFLGFFLGGGSGWDQLTDESLKFTSALVFYFNFVALFFFLCIDTSFEWTELILLLLPSFSISKKYPGFVVAHWNCWNERRVSFEFQSCYRVITEFFHSKYWWAKWVRLLKTL